MFAIQRASRNPNKTESCNGISFCADSQNSGQRVTFIDIRRSGKITHGSLEKIGQSGNVHFSGHRICSCR